MRSLHHHHPLQVKLWIKITELLALGRLFRALASDASVAIGFKATQPINRRIEKCSNPCCEHVASHCETCCEHVACNVQTSVGLIPPTSWHNTQATHVATRVVCNIQHQ
jgi:hypothetical protein